VTATRRGIRLLLAAALALAAAACSDDDVDDASTTTTSGPASTAGGAEADLVTVDLEGRPSAIALAGGDLLVADDEGSDAAGTVLSLDVETGRVLGSVPVGAQPVALVPVADGAWSIGATGLMTKVGLGGGRPALAAQVDLGAALVDGVVRDDRLWVADIGSSLVHVLDPETGEVVADPIVVEAGAVRLTAAGERLWVSGLEDQVTPIDIGALVARQPVRVGRAPIGMAAALDVLWVANSDDDTVSRISLESGQPVGEPIAVGDAPIAVVVDGADAWVLNQDGATLLRLDAETGEPIGAPIELPMRPRGMTMSPAGLWVVGIDPSRAVLVATG
jgi:DNA-binding beta-propeller fold protein YncE